MKRIITTAGLAAVSATGMQAAYAPGLSQMESSKLMTYSVSLRGFYDDNITTVPSSTGLKQNSFGFDLRPTISLNLTTLQQTYIGASYTYGLRYFFDREPHNSDNSHEFNARLEHAFSERYKLNLDESFVYAQEPEVIGDLGVLNRTDFSAYRNTAGLSFSAQLTELVGLGIGYNNSWYDYTQTGIASRSALLDRFEHAFRLDSRWLLQPKLTGRLGYRFTATDYTGNDDISPFIPGLKGEARNSTSHTVFAGGDYTFNPRLKASLDAGGRFTFYDDPIAGDDTISPYVSGSATYVYRENSFVQLGVSLDRSATDLIGTGVTAIASDSQALSPYISVSHRLTPQLTAGVLGKYNHYTYNGGTVDGLGEDFYILQLNLDYRLNEHWVVTTTYNYDKLNSDPGLVGRAFTRNRVFLGVSATY